MPSVTDVNAPTFEGRMITLRNLLNEEPALYIYSIM